MADAVEIRRNDDRSIDEVIAAVEIKHTETTQTADRTGAEPATHMLARALRGHACPGDVFKSVRDCVDRGECDCDEAPALNAAKNQPQSAPALQAFHQPRTGSAPT